MLFPAYAIAIIIILVIVSISTLVYFVLRRRRRVSVGADREEPHEEYLSEKSNSSPYAVKPLMGYPTNNKNSIAIDNSSTIKDGSENSSTSTIPPTTTTTYEKTRNVYENNNISTNTVEDTASSVWTATDSNAPVATTASAAEIKISLPLPPPGSSFFSDKMELDSIEANELYTSYMNVAAQQEYISIDLDDKPFLSNAAANIQQKAATLRNTLTKSMRRKSTSGGIPKVSLNQFFDNASSTTSVKSPRPESTRMSRQSSSTSSRFPTRASLQQSTFPPSPRPDSPASEFFGKFSNNSSKKSLVISDDANSSNKLMIENIPPESYFSLPMTPSTPSLPLTMRTTIQQQQEMAQQQQQEYMMQRQQQQVISHKQQQQQDDFSSIVSEINNNDLPSENSSVDEEEPDKESDSENQQDAAVQARKLIRSASRKSRTRSTIISEEAAASMLAMIANNTPSPSETPSTTTTASKYGTLRKHNIEVNTGSIRRSSFVDNNYTSDMNNRNWSNNNNNNDSPISPTPKRAIMSSTLSGSATVSGKKMATRQQLLAASFNNSSDNLFNRNTESVTLGRKSGNTGVGGERKEGPTSLRNLFTRPDDNKVAPMETTTTTIKKEEPLKVLTVKTNNNKEQISKVELEDDLQSAIMTPSSPIVPDSPSSSKNNTLRKMGNNVDTIRRMLQSSWSGNNLKESGSSSSLSSSSEYMGSVGSSYRPIASPLGSVNPRLQNQHLVSLSLKANAVQQGRSRPSMPIGFMNEGSEGPVPTASFSSSTVRTMIPADEEQQQQQETAERLKPKSVVSNILGSRQSQQQQSRQPSKLGDRLSKKTVTGKKTPAQIEREKYLKSLKT